MLRGKAQPYCVAWKKRDAAPGTAIAYGKNPWQRVRRSRLGSFVFGDGSMHCVPSLRLPDVLAQSTLYGIPVGNVALWPLP